MYEIDLASPNFIHIKELARRFSLTFGLEQVKIRDAMAHLQKEGIDYALLDWPVEMENNNDHMENEINHDLPPPNIAFFDILQEFCSKLLRIDREPVLDYLNKRIDEGTGNDS